MKDFLQNCNVCQRGKSDLAIYPEVLQTLPISDVSWSKINMDIINDLPKPNAHVVILVVVDRLNKYGHFISLKDPISRFITRDRAVIILALSKEVVHLTKSAVELIIFLSPSF